MILESIEMTGSNALFLGKTSGAFPECSDHLRQKSGNGPRVDGSCADPSGQGSADAWTADISRAVIPLVGPNLKRKVTLMKSCPPGAGFSGVSSVVGWSQDKPGFQRKSISSSLDSSSWVWIHSAERGKIKHPAMMNSMVIWLVASKIHWFGPGICINRCCLRAGWLPMAPFDALKCFYPLSLRADLRDWHSASEEWLAQRLPRPWCSNPPHRGRAHGWNRAPPEPTREHPLIRRRSAPPDAERDPGPRQCGPGCRVPLQFRHSSGLRAGDRGGLLCFCWSALRRPAPVTRRCCGARSRKRRSRRRVPPGCATSPQHRWHHRAHPHGGSPVGLRRRRFCWVRIRSSGWSRPHRDQGGRWGWCHGQPPEAPRSSATALPSLRLAPVPIAAGCSPRSAAHWSCWRTAVSLHHHHPHSPQRRWTGCSPQRWRRWCASRNKPGGRWTASSRRRHPAGCQICSRHPHRRGRCTGSERRWCSSHGDISSRRGCHGAGTDRNRLARIPESPGPAEPAWGGEIRAPCPSGRGRSHSNEKSSGAITIDRGRWARAAMVLIHKLLMVRLVDPTRCPVSVLTLWPRWLRWPASVGPWMMSPNWWRLFSPSTSVWWLWLWRRIRSQGWTLVPCSATSGVDLGGLAVDGRHRVGQCGDIPQPFGTEPGGVLPAEPFTEGVVGGDHIPMTVHVGHVDRALRPVVLPLGHLHPHHRCKNEGGQSLQHAPVETGVRP